MSEVEGFPQLEVTKKTGNEQLYLASRPLGKTLLDFWRWSASDLVSNTTRGILAEFIVANALGLADGVRVEWDAYDLVTSSGVKIEVKSSAYLQSWYHRKLSAISFAIRPTRQWNASTNEWATEVKRQADVYVFCLLHHTAKDSLDPLNLEQWEFYILRTSVLDAMCPGNKSITLTRLLKLNPQKANFDDLASCIEQVAH